MITEQYLCGSDDIGLLPHNKSSSAHAVDAPKAEDSNITYPDIAVADGQKFRLSGSMATVLAIPDHILSRVSYYVQQENMVFSGETRFHSAATIFLQAATP